MILEVAQAVVKKAFLRVTQWWLFGLKFFWTYIMLPNCFIFHIYKMPVTKRANSHDNKMLQSEYKLGNRQKVGFFKIQCWKYSWFFYIFLKLRFYEICKVWGYLEKNWWVILKIHLQFEGGLVDGLSRTERIRVIPLIVRSVEGSFFFCTLWRVFKDIQPFSPCT